jgi:beta-glucanase (GH16 family)
MIHMGIRPRRIVPALLLVGLLASAGRDAVARAQQIRPDPPVDPIETITHVTQTGGSGSVTYKPAKRNATDPSGDAMPIGNLPGWRQTSAEDFDTPVPLGSFPTAVAAQWTAYPSPWKDTAKRGTYSPLKVVEVNNGILSEHIRTENGVPLVAAIMPKLNAGGPGSGMLYGRFAVRFRSDPLPGYSIAWLLWPDSGVWPRDGEIDFPEMALDSRSVGGYVHHQNASSGDDKTAFMFPADITDWHTAVIEWSPDLVVFQLDGVEVGRATTAIPNTPMHWVLQTETVLRTPAPPDPSVAGDVQIDWVAAWAYDPTVS